MAASWKLNLVGAQVVCVRGSVGSTVVCVCVCVCVGHRIRTLHQNQFPAEMSIPFLDGERDEPIEFNLDRLLKGRGAYHQRMHVCDKSEANTIRDTQDNAISKLC